MADTTTGTFVAEIPASLTPELTAVDGKVTTTSNQIAEHFGKTHKSVLRAIRNLDCSPEYHQRNFAPMVVPVEIGGGATRNDPAFRLTRDGFVFLAMGFTGKEAAQWKEAYIEAFNRMESELLGKTIRPANPAIDYTRISPAQAQDLKELVHTIVESGVQGFGETWRRLHNKFRVNSYLELPAASFADARAYLLDKLPAQTAMPKIITPAPTAADAKRRRLLTLVEPNGIPQTVELADDQHIFSTAELCSHIENEVLARGDLQAIARSVCTLTMRKAGADGAHQFNRIKA